MLPSIAQDDLSALQLDTLRAAGHWQARYRLLMQWGDAISAKPELRLDVLRVRGCETALWLQHEACGGQHYFAVDGDSRIIKGMAALLLLAVNGKNSADISAMPLSELLRELKLASHLTPSRSNGFNALVEKVRALVGDN